MAKYYSLFKMGSIKRKESGKIIRVSAHEAGPRSEKSLQSLPTLEGIVLKSLIERGLIEGNVESPTDLGVDDGANTTGA